MPIEICKRCKQEFECEHKRTYSNKQEYCYSCRELLRNGQDYKKHRVAVKEDNPVVKVNTNDKQSYIVKQADWFNAGRSCGKQGELRDKYLEMRYTGLEDIEIYHQIKDLDKWQIEIKGLNLEQQCGWLLGFYQEINHV